jgi:hypothetical protein
MEITVITCLPAKRYMDVYSGHGIMKLIPMLPGENCRQEAAQRLNLIERYYEKIED